MTDTNLAARQDALRLVTDWLDKNEDLSCFHRVHTDPDLTAAVITELITIIADRIVTTGDCGRSWLADLRAQQRLLKHPGLRCRTTAQAEQARITKLADVEYRPASTEAQP